MGHYASEMDPSWGEPSPSEKKLSEVEDVKVRRLASILFSGFNSGSYLDNSNAASGVSAAQAIDELIRTRIAEALDNSTSESSST